MAMRTSPPGRRWRGPSPISGSAPATLLSRRGYARLVVRRLGRQGSFGSFLCHGWISVVSPSDNSRMGGRVPRAEWNPRAFSACVTHPEPPRRKFSIHPVNQPYHGTMPPPIRPSRLLRWRPRPPFKTAARAAGRRSMDWVASACSCVTVAGRWIRVATSCSTLSAGVGGKSVHIWRSPPSARAGDHRVRAPGAFACTSLLVLSAIGRRGSPSPAATGAVTLH